MFRAKDREYNKLKDRIYKLQDDIKMYRSAFHKKEKECNDLKIYLCATIMTYGKIEIDDEIIQSVHGSAARIVRFRDEAARQIVFEYIGE